MSEGALVARAVSCYIEILIALGLAENAGNINDDYTSTR
jgi:hypothetical protein